MFPQAFQFNEKYLIAILEHTYSCQYGTFIGKCDKQRQNLKLSERTYSLWGYLVTHNDEFVNPLYEKSTYAEILKPNLSPQNRTLFLNQYFCLAKVEYKNPCLTATSSVAACNHAPDA